MPQSKGASADAETGSTRFAPEAPAGLRPTGDDPARLEAVAAAIQKARKPSYALDQRIADAAFPGERLFKHRDGSTWAARFTVSLDAADGLKPEDWAVTIDATVPGMGIIAKLFPPRIGYLEPVEARAKTEAMARAAAGLLAMATEARRAETAKTGSVHEGAGRQASPSSCPGDTSNA